MTNPLLSTLWPSYRFQLWRPTGVRRRKSGWLSSKLNYDIFYLTYLNKCRDKPILLNFLTVFQYKYPFKRSSILHLFYIYDNPLLNGNKERKDVLNIVENRVLEKSSNKHIVCLTLLSVSQVLEIGEASILPCLNDRFGNILTVKLFEFKGIDTSFGWRRPR